MIFRILVILVVMSLVQCASSQFAAAPTVYTKFVHSGEFANTDKAYIFNVPKDGQNMLIQLKRRMPMNSWKAIDMEIYDSNDNYLFSYREELWSETGSDSDGPWTEYYDKAEIEIRLPHKGDYQLYLSDSASYNPSTADIGYSFRVTPILGETAVFTKLSAYFIFAAIFVYCICHWFYSLRGATDREATKKIFNTKRPESRPKRVFIHCLLIGSLFVWGGGYWHSMFFMAKDFRYNQIAKRHKKIAVDKNVRQQSVDNRSSRSGTKGGK